LKNDLGLVRQTPPVLTRAPLDLALEFRVDLSDQHIGHLISMISNTAGENNHSAACFASLAYFFITRSRFSFEIWSMKRTPLRWSISCWMQVAKMPSASTSCNLPSRSR